MMVKCIWCQREMDKDDPDCFSYYEGDKFKGYECFGCIDYDDGEASLIAVGEECAFEVCDGCYKEFPTEDLTETREGHLCEECLYE